MIPDHVRKRTRVLPALFAGMLLCGCQQIDSISSQKDDLEDFSSMALFDKNVMIDDWYKMISLEEMKKADKHCCYIRYQHALKNFAQLVREADYKKNNNIKYGQIISDYFNVAKSSTDLSFMLECAEDKSKTAVEITNIRKTAAASLITLNDEELFQELLQQYSNTAYEPQVQLVIADGLIKYHPGIKNDIVCADIIRKSIFLKQQHPEIANKKEIEHLIGISTSLSSLNEAIKQIKDNTPVLELVLELNLNYWRKLLKENLNFSEQAALENIAQLKYLALSPASKKVNDLVFFTLCETVPAETLVVLNTKMEKEPSFDNMKKMLSFYQALNKGNTGNKKLDHLTNTDKAIQSCKALAKEFLKEKIEILPGDKQKETYEIYAKNLPEQLYVFLIDKFTNGQSSASFYEYAVNATLWVTSQKIYSGKQISDIENAIDKLLFSYRHKTDYKKVFELVFANKTTYLNQWKEMRNSAAKSDVVQKDAFADSFVTLISKIKTGKNIPADFDARNVEVFEYIMATMDASAILKLIPYLEKNGQQKFLLEKYFTNAFEKGKLNSSTAHLSVAGDMASRYLTDLKENPKLYKAYKKLFLSGISAKDDNASLLCADYYFRITEPGDKKSIEQGWKDFSTRWPDLRSIPQNRKN